MALYRCVSLDFWTDPKVDDEFTPEDKYFYLYLLTNPHTTICGCYELSLRRASRELGYNEDTVERLIGRMENVHHVLKYHKPTKEVLIFNWHKYNWTKSPKLLKAVEASLENIKFDEFRTYVADTVSIRYPYPMDTSDTDTTTNLSNSIGLDNTSISKPIEREEPRTDPELAELVQHFEQAVGNFPRSALDVLQRWRKVYDKDVLLLAMDKAAEAGKRSWSYTNGILKGWQRDGIKCTGDVAAHEDLRNKQKANAPRNKMFMASRPQEEAEKAGDWLKDAGKRRAIRKQQS